MSKLASVKVNAKVTRKIAEILVFRCVSLYSRVSSWRMEFRTKYQEKKDQSPRKKRLRRMKKLVERYPPFAINFAPTPCVAAGLDQT